VLYFSLIFDFCHTKAFRIMIKQTLLAVIFVTAYGFCTSIFGQKPVTIKLDNPSFEDTASAAHTPIGWFDCGFAAESAPDVQPGSHGVNKKAFEGKSYVGMVVRDNNTWEAVGQKLKTQLLRDVKYSFGLYLCRSQQLESVSQNTGDSASYVAPVIIRIWGGVGYCDKAELLAESKLVNSYDWDKYDFIFKPKADYSYFMIEAFYKIPTLFPYNGNILIDNASAIVPISDKN
jgi:hypothetical protein